MLNNHDYSSTIFTEYFTEKTNIIEVSSKTNNDIFFTWASLKSDLMYKMQMNLIFKV